MSSFLNNLFLSMESWVLVYVVLAAFWWSLASWKKEGVRTFAWAALVVTTIVFVAGIFFVEVRQFFHVLLRR